MNIIDATSSKARGAGIRIAVSAVAAMLIVASSAWVLKTIRRCADIPFTWDSAGHAWEGLIIARDILTGDIVSFAADTWRQGWWPFFHSWLLAPGFMILGNTYTAARSVSLVCFIGFLIATYLAALELSRRKGHWVGLIAVVLAATSLPVLGLSAMSMTEIPALFLCSVAYLCYCIGLRNGSPWALVAASISMTAAFFTQSHIGLFLISAMLLTQVTGGQRILSRFNVFLFGPALAIAVVWFADPRHIWLFYNHSTFQPAFYSFWSFENWQYYPRVYLFLYHSSGILAVAVLFGALYSLRKHGDPALRVLFFNVLVGLALLIFKLDHRVRYIVSIVPSLWLLGSLGIVDFAGMAAERFSNVGRRVAVIATAGACLWLVPGIAATVRNYPNSIVRYEFWSDERQKAAYDFIAAQAPRDSHDFAVFTSFDYYNSLKSATIRWNLEVRDFEQEVAGGQKKELVMHYLREFIRRRDTASYRRLEDFLRYRNVNVYEYHLLSFARTLDPAAYESIRRNAVVNPFSDKMVDISALDPRVSCLIVILKDGEDQVNRYAADFLGAQRVWRATCTRRFDDLGVTISLYGRDTGESLRPVNE